MPQLGDFGATEAALISAVYTHDLVSRVTNTYKLDRTDLTDCGVSFQWASF